MNERIEALAKQAAEYAIEFAVKDQELYILKLMEKFAELIVQECAAIAKHNVMNISTYSDAEFVSDLINQHFGVE